MRNPCTFPECDSPRVGQGLCDSHYAQMRRGVELRPVVRMLESPPHEYRDEFGRKFCRTCREFVEVENFTNHAGYSSKDGLSIRCKTCACDNLRYSKFKVTREQYHLMLESQSNLCGICSDPLNLDERVAIDHDHSCCPGTSSCGKCIRGILHLKCNSMIGFANDDTDILKKAIEYLERYA